MLTACNLENRVIQGHSRVTAALFICSETGECSHNSDTKLDGKWIASFGRIVTHVTKSRRKREEPKLELLGVLSVIVLVTEV